MSGRITITVEIDPDFSRGFVYLSPEAAEVLAAYGRDGLRITCDTLEEGEVPVIVTVAIPAEAARAVLSSSVEHQQYEWDDDGEEEDRLYGPGYYEDDE